MATDDFASDQRPRNPAPMVRQWLSVHTSGEIGAHVPGLDTVWTRDVVMDFLPVAGDKIALWPDHDPRDEDDLFGGATWPVKERQFSVDGRAELDLVPMYVDPTRTLMQYRLLRDGTGMAWWSSQAGDPQQELPRGGWVRRV